MKSVKVRRILLPLVLFAVIGLLLLISAICTKQRAESLADAPVRVYFLDVGQGDCAVAETPDGNLLIDAGPTQNAADTLRELRQIGITGFAYAIFTHPHADHIGGAAAILEAVPVETVILSDAASTSWQQEDLLETLAKTDASVQLAEKGDVYTLGGLSVEILSAAAVGDGLNDASIVCKLTYGDVSVLFVGDAETALEEKLLSDCPDTLRADILKIGHHGAASSSTAAFLQAVKPKIAVISVGRGNSFGHPAPSVLNRLKDIGAEVYRTDKQGSIAVATDGKSYSVRDR